MPQVLINGSRGEARTLQCVAEVSPGPRSYHAHGLRMGHRQHATEGKAPGCIRIYRTAVGIPADLFVKCWLLIMFVESTGRTGKAAS